MRISVRCYSDARIAKLNTLIISLGGRGATKGVAEYTVDLDCPSDWQIRDVLGAAFNKDIVNGQGERVGSLSLEGNTASYGNVYFVCETVTRSPAAATAAPR